MTKYIRLCFHFLLMQLTFLLLMINNAEACVERMTMTSRIISFFPFIIFAVILIFGIKIVPMLYKTEGQKFYTYIVLSLLLYFLSFSEFTLTLSFLAQLLFIHLAGTILYEAEKKSKVRLVVLNVGMAIFCVPNASLLSPVHYEFPILYLFNICFAIIFILLIYMENYIKHKKKSKKIIFILYIFVGMLFCWYMQTEQEYTEKYEIQHPHPTVMCV